MRKKWMTNADLMRATNSIIGNAERLLNDPALTETQRIYVEEIISDAARVLELLKERGKSAP
jgi:hypothetical protein